MTNKNIERKGGKGSRERKGEESSNIVAEIWWEWVCMGESIVRNLDWKEC